MTIPTNPIVDEFIADLRAFCVARGYTAPVAADEAAPVEVAEELVTL